MIQSNRFIFSKSNNESWLTNGHWMFKLDIIRKTGTRLPKKIEELIKKGNDFFWENDEVGKKEIPNLEAFFNRLKIDKIKNEIFPTPVLLKQFPYGMPSNQNKAGRIFLGKKLIISIDEEYYSLFRSWGMKYYGVHKQQAIVLKDDNKEIQGLVMPMNQDHQELQEYCKKILSIK